MLCKKLYNRFLEDTGLDDEIYKAVFLKLDLCFSSLLCKPLKFEIMLPNTYTNTIELQQGSTINSDTFDIIYNLFSQNISYPKNSKIQAFFENTTNNSNSSLELATYINGKFNYTSQLQTLKNAEFYNLIFPRFEITNLLTDFYKYFSVFNTYFAIYPKTLPLPIKVLCESKKTSSHLDKTNNAIEVKIAQKSSLISGLKEQLHILLEQAASVDTERKLCLLRKSDIESLPEKWKNLMSEKDILNIQLQGLLESEKYYSENLNKFQAILEEINTIFTSYQNEHVKEAYKDKQKELENLKMKKIDVQKSIDKLKQILDGLSSQKNSILQDMKRIDSLLSQLEKVDATELKALNEKYNELTQELSILQNKIAPLQSQIQLEESTLAELQNKSTAFFFPSYLENKKEEIYNILSTSSKTQPILIVENYIKFLLEYESEKYKEKHANINNTTSIHLSCIYEFLYEYCNVTIPTVVSMFELYLPESSNYIKVTE